MYYTHFSLGRRGLGVRGRSPGRGGFMTSYNLGESEGEERKKIDFVTNVTI